MPEKLRPLWPIPVVLLQQTLRQQDIVSPQKSSFATLQKGLETFIYQLQARMQTVMSSAEGK